MSGSRPDSEGHLAEQHLGDRLSALVDGELGHDARERVLAHVATCPKCKAEVDAQRRLKNVFAEAAPPAPSESFLARLQGLPGGGDADDGGSPFAGLPGFGATTHSGVFGTGPGERFEFDYVPARPHAPVLSASSQGRAGFRIHDVGKQESERSASRGLRIAFAAAGAVSLAALALGGVTLGTPDTSTEARGSGSGSNVTPMRTPGSAAATGSESQRRRTAGPLLGQGQRMLGDTPVAPTTAAAPLLPGMPAPAGGDLRQQAVRALTTPVTAGAAVMSPLIRPLEAVPPLSLSSWSASDEVRPPGLLSAPDPAPSPYPAASPAASSPPVR
ncbi:anti-sigma factor family protein [Streptomyces sp. NRRL F-4707]|uniref:anti-sigma factor family protein n=1 Tax=Streptomyces sp. NRRL F-4707 TaxID=1519496 RepID=UPI0006AF21CB|nr:zf-HC2 domain-containing protein [Streptomyces sp. NRRL F-4707]